MSFTVSEESQMWESRVTAGRHNYGAHFKAYFKCMLYS